MKSRIDLDVNSDVPTLTPNNAKFDINLEQSINIPQGAFNVTVRVEEATVWNTVANISAGLNNNLMSIEDGGLGADVITIPDGTYSTKSLSDAINREYTSGPIFGTANLVTLSEDFPTQRVILNLNGTLAAGDQIVTVDWTIGNTFRTIVGFDATVEVNNPANSDSAILAPNVAAFNNIEYFLIHWNGGQGIRINDKYTNVMTRVNITSPPGSQVVSQPFNPAKSEAGGWVGNPRKEMTFWLTDQNNVEVDTGEIWSLRFAFEWDQLTDTGGPRMRPESGSLKEFNF